jgi:signal peptidase I
MTEAKIMDAFFKNLNEIMKVLLNAVLFVVFPIVAFTLITSKTPMLFGIRSYVVLTGSMEPTVGTGSILYTKSASDYHDGEIIAFKSGDVTVTHRVVSTIDLDGKTVSGLVSPISGAQTTSPAVFFQTKGDANKSVDSKLVSRSQVVGKALIHIPSVGRVINFLKTPLGFLLLIVGPTLLFIFGELWNIKKELERNMEKKFRERMRYINE